MEWLKTHRNDAILIAVLLALGGALALFWHAARQEGGVVRVQVDGETVLELPLSENTQVVLGGDGHANTLAIENGAARITQADCPDQICVSRGAVRYTGESIVCLPHRLVVSVEGGQGNDIDAAAG